MLREKSKASKRRAILTAAAKEFARRPYHEVLLEDIAVKAEVAKGTLYLYFKSKADLYLALAMESMAPLIDRLQEQMPDAAQVSAWSAIRLFINEALAFKVEHPALHEVLRETSRASVEATCGDMKHALRGLVEQALRKGVASGELVDAAPEVTADLMLAAISQMGEWMLTKRNKWTPATMAAHLLRLFGNGLLAAK